MVDIPLEFALWALAGSVILASVTSPLLGGMKDFVGRLQDVLTHVCAGLGVTRTALASGLPRLQGDIGEFGNGVSTALGLLAGGLTSFAGALRPHLDKVVLTITQSARSPAQRFLGAFIYMGALIAFVYADAALGFNTVAAITAWAGLPPPSLPAPLAFLIPYLKDITVPLVIAFTVNMFMLSVILGDLFHLTDLAPWPQTGWMRILFRVMAIVNMTLVLSLAACFMLARFVELTPGLDLGTANSLRALSSFAMNAITVPSFITTALLWPAVFSVFVLWLLLVGLFWAVLRGGLALVSWLQSLSPLLARGVAVIIKWLLEPVLGALPLLEWVFRLVQKTLDGLATLITWGVTLAGYLPTVTGRWLTRFDFIRKNVLKLP